MIAPERRTLTIGVDNCLERLNALESDLINLFNDIKMYGKIEFSREVKTHFVRGKEHYLYAHCDPQCADQVWTFIHGFVCGRNAK
jgi:elongation factor P hydroxylase